MLLHPSLKCNQKPLFNYHPKKALNGSGNTPAIVTQSGNNQAQKRVVIQPGAIIDKYRIDALIGRGGFAVVYRATHRILQTQVALKIIKPKLSRQHPQLIHSVCEEARFAAQINHPNIVKIIDVTGNRKLSYIVMEYIDGNSVRSEIEEHGALPLQSACSIIQQVCRGLQAALDKGLVHRDIKPANIILPKDGGDVRIVDLGLASQVGLNNDDNDPSVDLKQRRILGTPAYMPPEQAMDPNSCDHRSDIYSLGISFFSMLCGKLPYRATKTQDYIKQHIEAPIPLAHQLNNEIPSQISLLISSMMAKRPQDRPQSYTDIIDELEPWTRDGSSSGGIRSWMQRFTQSR